MRVLLVNQYFPPDTSATAGIAAEVVRALAAAGHEVRVIAGRPSYGTGALPWRWRSVERHADCVVERVGSTAFERRLMPGRVANYVTYLALALLHGWRWRADVVLAMTDPPLAAFVGGITARLRGVPMVYNIRDLHPDMALAAGMMPPGALARLWRALHARALRWAARVIVLGDDMRTRVIAKGVAPERVVVVRDGVVLPMPGAGSAGAGGAAAANGALTREIRGSAGFVVMHAGNIGHGGAWDALLAAAALLAADGVELVFVGDGAARAGLRRQAAGIAAVRWIDRRPAADVPAVLAAGDLQVVTVRSGLEGVIVPSKLYPVLAAGRPVLAVAPEMSDVVTIVREHACGWVADPADAADIARVVREAMRDPADLAERGRRGRAAAARFDRGALLAQYVREIEAVIPRGTSRGRVA